MISLVWDKFGSIESRGKCATKVLTFTDSVDRHGYVLWKTFSNIVSTVATFYYACDICPGLFIYFNAPCPRTEYDKAHIQMYGHHMGRGST